MPVCIAFYNAINPYRFPIEVIISWCTDLSLCASVKELIPEAVNVSYLQKPATPKGRYTYS